VRQAEEGALPLASVEEVVKDPQEGL
jgi:hypothetical protein